MVSIGARKRALAGYSVYHNGSIDTSFDPPLFSLDSTFKQAKSQSFTVCHNGSIDTSFDRPPFSLDSTIKQNVPVPFVPGCWPAAAP
jgi:hypothetical protein